MPDLKARVRNGRLILDEPTDLPEGAVVDLVPADWWDDLSQDGRRRLDEALARSEQDVRAGRVIPASIDPQAREVMIRAVWHAVRGSGPDLN